MEGRQEAERWLRPLLAGGQDRSGSRDEGGKRAARMTGRECTKGTECTMGTRTNSYVRVPFFFPLYFQPGRVVGRDRQSALAVRVRPAAHCVRRWRMVSVN